MPHVVRVSKLDLASVLAQPNPHIDLRLGAYETSSRNFLKAVSNYTQRAVTEITHRKNNYVSNKGKIVEKSKQLEQETNQCKVKELELMTGMGSVSYFSTMYLILRSTWEGAGRTERSRSFSCGLPTATCHYQREVCFP